MSRRNLPSHCVALLAIALVLGSVTLSRSQAPASEINAAALHLFRPLPASLESTGNPATPAKVNLGRMLYYDARLSADQKVSCNSCHPLDKYGAQNQPVSTGFKNQKGGRNAPTVYNAAAHFVQFWDGRAPTIEEQAKGPVTNPVEMALPDGATAVRTLKSIPEYVSLFQQAFPTDRDPVTFDNMASAIGAFERGLITPARWDRFLAGDKSALSAAEKTGFNKFVETGCQTCHNGPYLGGSSFQKLGIFTPWPNTKDEGRQAVTHQAADRMVFKVPSLRNVNQTAPYFHDGSIATIEDAIRSMGVHQRGARLTDAEVHSIKTWFDSLTGVSPDAYIRPPALPKSSVAAPPAGE